MYIFAFKLVICNDKIKYIQFCSLFATHKKRSNNYYMTSRLTTKIKI